MAPRSETGVTFFASGYCKAHTNIVNPVEGRGKTKFYAVWALLRIPRVGYVLFDSGYSEAFQTATQPFPERLYRWLTPVTISAGNTAKGLLETEGIAADQIKYVIISHFHADHIAGLSDFTKAQFICHSAAYEEVQSLTGIKAVSKGILHQLLPENFSERVLCLEEFADEISINDSQLTEYKLFGVTDFRLVLLPGHARGMLGFIHQSKGAHLFYGSDAAWDYNAFRREILPRKVVKLFFDSWADYIDTLEKIRAFEEGNPNVNILFTHCPKTLDHISNGI